MCRSRTAGITACAWALAEQPLASIVRIADLCTRIEALPEESPLLLTHVIELALLMFVNRTCRTPWWAAKPRKRSWALSRCPWPQRQKGRAAARKTTYGDGVDVDRRGPVAGLGRLAVVDAVGGD